MLEATAAGAQAGGGTDAPARCTRVPHAGQRDWASSISVRHSGHGVMRVLSGAPTSTLRCSSPE
jgi:hypothetical protein